MICVKTARRGVAGGRDWSAPRRSVPQRPIKRVRMALPAPITGLLMHPGINQRDKAGGEQLFHSRDGVVLALANARRNAHPAPPPSRHRRADRYQYRVLLLTSIDPTRATQDSTRPIGQGHLLRCFQPVIPVSYTHLTLPTKRIV